MQTPSYKICPKCRQAAVLSASTCLRCGHVYRTVYADPETRTQVVQPTLPSICWSCRSPIPAAAIFCSHCGSQIRNAGYDVHPRPVFDPPARTGMIVSVWTITIINMLLMFTSQGALYGLVLLLDCIAVGLAIALVCGRSRTDKINGWIKIGLELLAMVVAMAIAIARY